MSDNMNHLRWAMKANQRWLDGLEQQAQEAVVGPATERELVQAEHGLGGRHGCRVDIAALNRMTPEQVGASRKPAK